MAGLSAFLLTLASAFGPNGWMLAAHLESPDAGPRLPLDAFVEIVPRLWVVHHDDREAMMAFYLPAAGREDAEGAAALAWRLAVTDSRAARLLPELRVPRIFLHAPYYRPEGRPRTFCEMPVDVALYLMSALIEASLDLAPPEGFGRRTEAYGHGIPSTERRGAYVSALAQFGSDLISTAGELRRSLARQRAAGKDPCRIVDHPGTLFAHWQRIMTSTEYRGLYRPPAAPPGTWAQGPPLAPADKRFLVERLLGGAWTGDVRRDFELECP